MKMEAFVKIGTDEKAVIASKEAILEILGARADQETIRVALNTLGTSIQPRNIILDGCTFVGEEQIATIKKE